MGYLWAREVGVGSQSQHYHLAVLLNQHLFRNSYYVIHDCIEPICEGWGWPKPFTPENFYYVVRRGDQQSYDDAFYRASYSCKTRTKGVKALVANDYGSSRIKLNLEIAA